MNIEQQMKEIHAKLKQIEREKHRLELQLKLIQEMQRQI